MPQRLYPGSQSHICSYSLIKEVVPSLESLRLPGVWEPGPERAALPPAPSGCRQLCRLQRKESSEGAHGSPAGASLTAQRPPITPSEEGEYGGNTIIGLSLAQVLCLKYLSTAAIKGHRSEWWCTKPCHDKISTCNNCIQPSFTLKLQDVKENHMNQGKA